MIDASHMDTIPLKAQVHAHTGIVLRYATPEIQRNQVWPDETYYVCLEGETAQRTFNRSSLVVLP